MNFSEINLKRCNDPKAFNCGDKKPEYFLLALMEELGEIVGAFKKLNRGYNSREDKKIIKHLNKELDNFKENPPKNIDERVWFTTIGHLLESIEARKSYWIDLNLQKLSFEAADVAIYLNLFCQKSQINLSQSILSKFNKVSMESEFSDKYILPNNFKIDICQTQNSDL